MHRTVLALIVSLAVALAAPAAHKTTAAHPADDAKKVAVTIDNFNFAPGTLTIPAGTTVVWTNKDDVPHNVISTDKLFASPVLDTDEHFEFTFKNAGTFNYYCSIHPKMTAKVVVQ